MEENKENTENKDNLESKEEKEISEGYLQNDISLSSDNLHHPENISIDSMKENSSLMFRRIKKRREYFDFIKDFIAKKGEVILEDLEAYVQYTTGTSIVSIRQALATLERLGLIECDKILKGELKGALLYSIKKDKVRDERTG